RLPGTRMEIWRLLDEQLRTRSAGRRTRRMCISRSLEFLLRDPEVLSRHPVPLLVVRRAVPARDPDPLELDRGALQAGDYLVEILAVFGVEQALARPAREERADTEGQTAGVLPDGRHPGGEPVTTIPSFPFISNRLGLDARHDAAPYRSDGWWMRD